MDKLYSLEMLEMFLANPSPCHTGAQIGMAQQLLDTMHDNERLRDALNAAVAALGGKYSKENALHIALGALEPYKHIDIPAVCCGCGAMLRSAKESCECVTVVSPKTSEKP